MFELDLLWFVFVVLSVLVCFGLGLYCRFVVMDCWLICVCVCLVGLFLMVVL